MWEREHTFKELPVVYHYVGTRTRIQGITRTMWERAMEEILTISEE